MVLESLGRVTYVFILVLAELYAQREAQLAFPVTLLVVVFGLQAGAFGLDSFGKLLAKKETTRWKEASLGLGMVGYCASLVAMVELSKSSEAGWHLWLDYTLYLLLALLYSMPPLHLNIHGAGSVVLFLMNGIVAVELVTLGLNIGWSLQAILECIPSHLLLQASLVVKELSSLKEDSSITSTAGLLGRHDSFRFVVLMHFFAFLFVAVDFAALSYWRGLPLVLVLWSLPLLYNLRHFRLAGLWKSYYRLFLTFTLLYACGIMLECEQFLDDLKATL